ncbi:MAG: 4Fe-4S dicluster domain-containing protein [Desulforudis sp.]|nr:MAG: 4Fe-4S dicluster domain-containing protein [Desulforudis sp.]
MPLMSGNLIKNLFSGPATRPYPIVKREPFPRARARLAYDPDKCTYCGICANICPAAAISVEEDRENLHISRVYNSFACISCARCAELCPQGSLRMEVSPHGAADAKTVAYSASKET